jgi:hypothetical protein
VTSNVDVVLLGLVSFWRQDTDDHFDDPQHQLPMIRDARNHPTDNTSDLRAIRGAIKVRMGALRAVNRCDRNPTYPNAWLSGRI